MHAARRSLATASAATRNSHLQLVRPPPQRMLGDLLHDLARRPCGAIYIQAITHWVLFLLKVLPPES